MSLGSRLVCQNAETAPAETHDVAIANNALIICGGAHIGAP